MTMSDPLADMLTRIRNAHMRSKKEAQCPHSRIKTSVLDVLRDEGYIRGYRVEERDRVKKDIVIELKYHEGQPAIREISRVSRPGRRVYAAADSLPVIYNHLGVAVISTSKGVVADAEARRKRIGGEVLCKVF